MRRSMNFEDYVKFAKKWEEISKRIQVNIQKK